MNLEKIDWSLYAILDKAFQKNRGIGNLAEEAISGGAGLLQLRNKISSSRVFYEDTLRVQEVTSHFGVPLIINDRVDIALAAKAEGVHLGQKDLPFEHARKLIGEEMILGASVHNLEELMAAKTGRPNYYGVGTIFASKTKNHLAERGLEIVGKLREKTRKPLIAIGGITVENLAAVIQAGADGVAVISDLFDRGEVKVRAQQFLAAIERARTRHES